MGVMTTTGSVKPFSQPRKPFCLMEQPQQMKLVISAQVTVVERSAVAERKMPVMPMSVPNSDERNSAPM